MAKAKKTPSVEAASPAASEPQNKKAAPKPVAKKATKAAAPAQPAAPMIDTNLAAATAAKLVAHKDDLAPVSASAHGETAAFKQMKENLHKPGQSSPSFLHTPSQGKKFNNAVPGRHQQLGRNQTFGADVNRTGVPRRTGGG